MFSGPKKELDDFVDSKAYYRTANTFGHFHWPLHQDKFNDPSEITAHFKDVLEDFSDFYKNSPTKKFETYKASNEKVWLQAVMSNKYDCCLKLFIKE